MLFECSSFQIAVAPWPLQKRPAHDLPGFRSLLADMVKQLLVGYSLGSLYPPPFCHILVIICQLDCLHLQTVIAPCAHSQWETTNHSSMTALFMKTIELFIISGSSTNVLNLNPPTFLNDGISFLLELHHGRKVSRNCVRRPHLCVNDTVKRPAELFDCSKASQ